MKTWSFENNWGDDVIDSRDIVERLEELLGYQEDLEQEVRIAEEDLEDYINKYGEEGEDYEELNTTLRIAEDALEKWLDSEEGEELSFLAEINKIGETQSSEWIYGESLIKDEYFTDLIKELIEDCYELPEDFKNGSWPWKHMEMNWDEAADEAKQDYTVIYAQGETYWVRS